MKLTYAIKFVGDMAAAKAFYHDVLGLPVIFESPWWTELGDDEVKLALHPAGSDHPAGSVQLGFGTDDLDAFYAARDRSGIVFTEAPREQFGTKLASFLDSDGAECRVSAQS